MPHMYLKVANFAEFVQAKFGEYGYAPVLWAMTATEGAQPSTGIMRKSGQCPTSAYLSQGCPWVLDLGYARCGLPRIYRSGSQVTRRGTMMQEIGHKEAKDRGFLEEAPALPGR